MSAQWTGDLVGRMHNAHISQKEFLGKNEKYVSQVLNGHCEPKRAEQEYNAALDELIRKKER